VGVQPFVVGLKFDVQQIRHFNPIARIFSSTIIISSWRQTSAGLTPRIAVGFLIVQELTVVIAMRVTNALRDDGAAMGICLRWRTRLRCGCDTLLSPRHMLRYSR
jgi:hypothetical protein